MYSAVPGTNYERFNEEHFDCNGDQCIALQCDNEYESKLMLGSAVGLKHYDRDQLMAKSSHVEVKTFTIFALILPNPYICLYY